MDSSTGTAQTASGASPGHRMGVAAAALAVLCAADLCGLLIIVWAGGVPWSGLTWIAMIGLPLTFLLLGAALILAIRRRRSL